MGAGTLAVRARGRCQERSLLEHAVRGPVRRTSLRVRLDLTRLARSLSLCVQRRRAPRVQRGGRGKRSAGGRGRRGGGGDEGGWAGGDAAMRACRAALRERGLRVVDVAEVRARGVRARGARAAFGAGWGCAPRRWVTGYQAALLSVVKLLKVPVLQSVLMP